MIRLLFLLLAIPALARAASTPDDFIRGFRLDFDNGAALQRVELPYEVLAASLQPDLGDIRVFDSQGRDVPMKIQKMGGAQPAPERVHLPLFPLTTARGGTDGTRISVTTPDGQKLHVHMDVPQASGTDSILVDAGRYDRISELDFSFVGPTGSLIPITVRGSDDLVHWTHVADATLLYMVHPGGQVISQTRARLSGRTWAYYMVTGRDLTSLVAAVEAMSGGTGTDVPRRWAALDLKALGNDTYEGTRPAALPVDRLDLDGTENTVLGLSILQADASGKWRSVQSGVLFHITEQDRRIHSEPMQVRLGTRFRVHVTGNMQPLRQGWIARELLFLPQGQGPYTLAVGSRQISAGPDLLTPVIGTGGTTLHPGEATLGPARALGGSDDVPSRTPILLWSVLTLGVIILGGMAWRLGRDILRPQ